jgi:DNA-binding response OmpR family regulator
MKHRILVVEDELELLKALATYLTSSGYEVHSVSEPEAAQALLGNYTYSLVITDLALTNIGFTGLDVLTEIWDRARRPRVIVLTGHGEPELQRAARLWGADAYMQKPKPFSEIATLAAVLLRNEHETVRTGNADVN